MASCIRGCSLRYRERSVYCEPPTMRKDRSTIDGTLVRCSSTTGVSFDRRQGVSFQALRG